MNFSFLCGTFRIDNDDYNMRKSDLFFNVLRLPVDFIMLLLAGLATYFFRTEILAVFRPVLFDFNLPLTRYLYLVIFVSLLFVAIYALSGLYSMRVKMRIGEEFLKILIASSAGILVVITYIFLRQELFDSRFLVLGGWFFAFLFTFTGRLIVRYLQRFLAVKYNLGIHNLLIIGTSEGALKLSQEINNDPALGYRIVKTIESPDFGELNSIVNDLGVNEIILTHPDYSENQILALIDLCNEHHIIFKFVPNISQLMAGNFSIDIFKGLPFIEIKRTSLDGWGQVSKRLLDIIISLLGLIILLLIFGIIAFAIKWETEGPVFVKLKRVSRSKEFELIKFRSMINNAHELNTYLRSMANDRVGGGPLWKMKNDPRITNTGRFIRRLRIDELPQLWNVLRGDMSMVGPRPHQPDEIAHYAKHHKKVLAIKAGATGVAQVSGSSDISFEQEVALDSFYIDNWSLWLDIRIILKTAFKMFLDRSAV